MFLKSKVPLVLGLSLFVNAGCVHSNVNRNPSESVEENSGRELLLVNSELILDTLKKERRLLDYSYAGYSAGEKGIPQVPNRVNLKTQYGAVGDGIADDTAALAKAVSEVKSGAIFLPAGKYRITKQIKINRSQVVIRGEGSGKTILDYPYSMSDVYGNEKNSYGNSKWSFGPSFIQVEGEDPIDDRTRLTKINSFAERGTKAFTVADVSRLRVGQWVRLVESDPVESGSLLAAIMTNLMPAGETLQGEKNVVRFHSRIKSIVGRAVILERPLPYDVKLEWNPELHVYKPTVKNFGLENLTIQFPLRPYQGHFQEEGFNAINLVNASDSWVKNIKIINSDVGVILNNSNFVTVDGLVFETTGVRDGGYGKWNGHHAIFVARGSDNLITNFDIRTRFAHDLTVSWYSLNTVFSNGRGIDINLDHHRAFNYGTLYSNIDLGAGDRPFESGGAPQRGPHAGAFTTFWNIYGRKSIMTPKQDFGPSLNFVNIKFSNKLTDNPYSWRILNTNNLTIPDLHKHMKNTRLKKR